MDTPTKIRIITQAKNLAWLYLGIAVMLKVFGFDLFNAEIDNERVIAIFEYIDSNMIISKSINIVLGLITTNLLCCIAMGDYKDKIISVNIYGVIYSVTMNLFPVFEYKVLSVIITSSILIFWIYNKVSFGNIAFCLFVDLVFQSISLYTRQYALQDMRDYRIFTIIFSIDYYLMLFIYCANKYLKGRNIWLSLVSDFGSCKTKNKGLKGKLLTLNVRRKQKNKIFEKSTILFKLRSMKLTLIESIKNKWLDRRNILYHIIIPFVFVVGVTFTFAWVSDKVLEYAMFIFAYGQFRYMFPKTFHADWIPNIKNNYIIPTCTILTALVACNSITLIVGANVSFLSMIVISIVICLLLYVVQNHFDYESKKPNIKELEKRYETDFTKYGLTAEMALFAYDYKVNKYSIKKQQEITGLSYQVVKNYRSTVNKAIKEFEKLNMENEESLT